MHELNMRLWKPAAEEVWARCLKSVGSSGKMGGQHLLYKATGNCLALGISGNEKTWKALLRSGGGTCQNIVTDWSETGTGCPQWSHSDNHLPAVAFGMVAHDQQLGILSGEGADGKKHPMFYSAETIFAADPSPAGNPICWISCRPQSCDSAEVRGNTLGRKDSNEDLKSSCGWLQHLMEPRCLTPVTYFLQLERLVIELSICEFSDNNKGHFVIKWCNL